MFWNPVWLRTMQVLYMRSQLNQETFHKELSFCHLFLSLLSVGVLCVCERMQIHMCAGECAPAKIDTHFFLSLFIFYTEVRVLTKPSAHCFRLV